MIIKNNDHVKILVCKQYEDNSTCLTLTLLELLRYQSIPVSVIGEYANLCAILIPSRKSLFTTQAKNITNTCSVVPHSLMVRGVKLEIASHPTYVRSSYQVRKTWMLTLNYNNTTFYNKWSRLTNKIDKGKSFSVLSHWHYIRLVIWIKAEAFNKSEIWKKVTKN